MELSVALVTLNESLRKLQERQGQITTADLEAEVINLACLEVLKRRRANRLGQGEADTIARAFAEAGMKITPHYKPEFAANARLAVIQNTDWDGMWDFLRGYFQQKHGVSIDGARTDRVEFISSRHSRYEHGDLVSESKVLRTISIHLLDGYKRIMVSIDPSLSSKAANLISEDGNTFMYEGDDDDYVFTILSKSGRLQTGGDVGAFYLQLIPRQVLIEYHESQPPHNTRCSRQWA